VGLECCYDGPRLPVSWVEVESLKVDNPFPVVETTTFNVLRPILQPCPIHPFRIHEALRAA